MTEAKSLKKDPFFGAIVNASVETRLERQQTLGDLIKFLSPFADEEETWVVFADMTAPTTFHSYRGYYDELAVGFTDESPTPRIGEFFKLLKNQVGSTHSGWKGGEFTMEEDTPVWKANLGMMGGEITGVRIGQMEGMRAIVLLVG